MVPRRCAITIVRACRAEAHQARRRVGTVASWSPCCARAGSAPIGARRRLRVHVADGDRQRVGGVVRRRHRGQPEQQLDHLLHLRLVGAAVADDRALDLGRRVLEDRHAGLDRRQHRDAARVPELQRAARR